MTSTCYWYSTNGMMQRRLPPSHSAILDQAFERHARIQLLIEDEDDSFFIIRNNHINNPVQQKQQHPKKQTVVIIANPYQGTMTAGDLHYGLYRQPPLWRISDASLDTLILLDDEENDLDDNDKKKDVKSRKSNYHNGHTDTENSDKHAMDSNIDTLTVATATSGATPVHKTESNSTPRSSPATRHDNKRFLRRQPLSRQTYMDDNCGICCIIS